MANRREKVEAVTDFIFFGSKITVDGFCSECTHEIKKKKTKKNTKTTHLLIGRKAITNLNSILKRKDNTFPTKVCIVKAMVFKVVM